MKLITKWKNILFDVLGRKPELVPQNCSRKIGHEGPCNGWPCKHVIDTHFNRDENGIDADYPS